MTQRESEFIILFNALWYKNFPIVKDFHGFGNQAGWTLHVAAAMREAANLMGLFLTFETGGKTDGEIHMFDETADNERQTWAKVEWEWTQATRPTVNEFDKLRQSANHNLCEVAVFFGRYKTEKLRTLLNLVSQKWTGAQIPLICFFLEINGTVPIIHLNKKKKVQTFGSLSTYRFAPNRNGQLNSRLIQKRKAYPWEVKGTRWTARRPTEFAISSFKTGDEE